MFSISYKQQKYLVVVGFLVIPLALLCIFSFYPALKLIFLSFTSWDGFSPTAPFVGLHNYRIIFTNGSMFQVFRHNFAYFIGGIVQNIIALYFAVVLNSAIRARNFWRVVLFLPYVLNSVAIAYMFKFVFQDTGALNVVLQHLGMPGLAHSWLGDPAIVNWTLAFVSLWKFMGFNMVIYLAALQSVDQELYEAATLDGATGFQQFRFITLPNIMSIVQINMLLTVSGALEVFDIPFVMTNASPDTSTFVTQTVNIAFKFDNYGLASAMGVVLLIIVMIVISIQRRLLGGGESVL
ncbi:MAG: sugar ABC transporter permease [Alicyclobacillus sp.]|nr:sugar ABC transporter permease [Alicyclobacillus sp.]